MFEKEGKLTGFELEVVKEHCFMAKELCEGVPGFAEIQNAFLYHHERVDGTGYPYRLKADRIPMLSQMLGLAEVYLAMTTERSYRRAMSRTEAYEEIRKLSGTAFRPDLVEALGRTL
nr:HD domain-containing phosphohydrolase [Cohnella hashimotonis]